MSELKQEQLFINDDNINDIFEQKVEVGAVIQFNLLQRIIEEFIKRQKSLNDKMSNIELKLNSVSVRPFSPKMSEENILKYFDESNINFETEKEISIKEKDFNSPNNVKSDREKNDNGEKTEKSDLPEKVVEKIDKIEKNETNYNINIEAADNKKELNHNQYRILSSRMDKFEKILKEITKKIYNSNDNNQNNEDNKMDNNQIKKHEEKIKHLEKEINQINKKIEEMNLIEVNLPNEKENETEEDKNKNTELIKKLTRKIELIEKKSRQNEEDIYKLKKEIKSINNAISVDKNNYNEFAKENNKNFSEIKNMINNEIKDLKKLMNENDNKIKNDLKDDFEKENNNIKSMIDELKNNTSNSNDSNININLISSKFNEKINNLNNDLKNLINKSSSETEKYLKSIINSLGIDNIKNELLTIQKLLKEKLVKTDLDYIDLKIKEIENRLITETLKIESLEKDVNACNDACTKSVKMIEYLSGQVVQNNQPEIVQKKRSDMLKGLLTVNERDMKSFVNKNEFSHEIKNIYKKIEQILEIESENYKFTQHMEGRLKYFVTQNDLKVMEQCLTNMVDEIKNNFARKYMEKTEILKNLKFLEIQIKTLYDSNPNMIKEGDNWLLAKKPMNNYLCASCEAYIGDLKNKNTYLPWNKIPTHDNKKYRMGNGFSRMLELVNTDLMKNAERINDNLIIKIDDKKINNDSITPLPLPRLGSQINLKKWNKTNNTFYAMNNDNVEKKLNNSADGLEQNSNSESMNKVNRNRMNNIQDLENVGKSMNNLGAGITKKTYDKNNKSPKVLKIVKKTKKDY